MECSLSSTQLTGYWLAHTVGWLDDTQIDGWLDDTQAG